MKKLLLLLVMALGICLNAFPQSSNTVQTPLVSTAQTGTTVNSADFTNFGYRGAHFVVNVSAYTGGNYTVHIQAKDPTSGTYYDVLVGPAISSTGITILKVYPGCTPTLNAAAADFLPLTYRVQLIGASTPNMTLSVTTFLEL